MRRRCLLTFAAWSLLGQASPAADWPQWRGPHRDGISEETGLLKKWPDGGPKLLWEAGDIHFGYSTPAVVGDRLYVQSNKGADDEFVLALAVKDGEQVWSTRLGKVGNPNQKPAYPGARSTPTVEGDVLYALGSDGDLVCLEVATGKERWRKNLRSDFGGEPGVWAYSESPLVDEGKVICTPGGKNATIVALDKKHGETLWKCEFPGGSQAAYSSAIAVETGSGREYVQFLAKGVVGVDAGTGKLLWRYEKTAQGSPANIPTPVAHDGYIYTASGRGGAGLVKLKAGGGTVEADQVYATPKLPTSIGGTVLVKDSLYGTNNRGLMCVDFTTGNEKWQDNAIGAASICYADGKLYLHCENGQVALVEATSSAYHELGRFTPPHEPKRGSSKAWAYPVVANGRLYIRDLGKLWCFDIKDGGTTN